jgi:hypothetical protein
MVSLDDIKLPPHNIEAEKAVLEARIKAFQDKVASITI